MDGVDDVVDGEPEFHRQDSFMDDVGGQGRHEVYADYSSGLRINHHLYHPSSVLDGYRLRHQRQIQHPAGTDTILPSRFLFRQTDAGDLGRSEHGVWHTGEINLLATPRQRVFGGEPLVRRDIGEIIEYAKHRGFVTTINTNGSLLPRKASALAEYLDFAFISLDYPKEYHDFIRGRRGSFQEVLKGIRLLLETGRTKVTLVSTISKLNLPQIEAMARFAQGLGVGLSYNAVEPTWTADYHDRATSVVADYGLTEPEIRFFYAELLELKHQGYPLMESEWVLRDYAAQEPWVCHFPKIFVYVSPEGFVFPCTHTFHHPLVNLRETSFTEYFTSNVYRDHVKKAEHCNECLRTCVRMYTYTYALHPLHLLTLTTAARMWARQIWRHRRIDDGGRAVENAGWLAKANLVDK